jgi:two-component system OmpR family sensor kinase
MALARARTPGELEAALRNASVETDRLVRLAEDLLVLSRASDGTLPLHRSETPIGDLLERAAAANRARAGAVGVDVRVRCQDSLAAVVDPERIRQALDDLLDNSLRQTPEGGTISLVADRKGERLRLAVQDTGAGFPPEVLEREPLGASGGDDAMGLGLAIVGAIARAHGGELRLENPEGGGALATLELPLGPAS